MHLRDISRPARGAYVALEDLIALRFPARQLKITRRSRALSALAGPNKSNFRGRGIDFEEVRSYQPGDDIRTMFFGSSHCFKSVLAAQLASLLAWSALDNGERVGGLVFNDAGHREVRPRRSRRTVLALLSEIDQYNHALPPPQPGDDNTFDDMLSNLRRIARPGTSLFLVSDFHGADSEAAREHLFQLAQHTQITALSCNDPLEFSLPRAGRYAVTDGSARSELNTADRSLQREYQVAMTLRQDKLKRDLRRLGVPLLDASTSEAPFALLQNFYGEQRR